jgi:transglutaminase-like putative cysteine protease
MVKGPNRLWGAFFIVLATCACVEARASSHEGPVARQMRAYWSWTSRGELDQTFIQDIRVNSPSAVREFGEINIPVNEHYVDLEVSDAVTIKPDGARVPIAPEKILESTLPNAPERSQFEADVKVRTLVFPGLGVGDTIHYVVKMRRKRSQLAGGLSYYITFSPSARFTAAEIEMDAPDAIAVKTFVAGLSEEVTKKDGVSHYRWKLHPQTYRPDEPSQTSPLDRDPRVLISTFPDDATLGGSFFGLAAAKSEPTGAVRELAAKVVLGVEDRRKQAAALYDWVTHNIRYFNIVLGSGGYEPHTADSILQLKYGDCKDAATLLRALLAARGVEADFALTNVAPVYKHQPLPLLSYDHVILYLPEFDVYVDPTATYTAFGELPGSDSDKPVLRIGKSGVRRARTPALNAAGNYVALKVDATLRPDGSPFGSTSTMARGQFAGSLRAAIAAMPKDGDLQWFEQTLLKQGWHGGGEIELADPMDHSEPYMVNATWGLRDTLIDDGSPTSPVPLGPLFVPSPVPYFTRYLDSDFTQDFPCPSGSYDVVVSLRIDPSQALEKTPRDVHVSTAYGSYDAKYWLEGASFFFGRGGTLHAERKLVFTTPGQNCTAEMAKKLRPVVSAARKDFEFIVAVKH